MNHADRVSAAKHFTDATFEKDVLDTPGPVLVDFWADWCGPCRLVGPVVEALAQEFQGRALVGKLDVDESPAVSERFGIRSIPTLLVFKDGKVVEKMVGAGPITALRALLERHLTDSGSALT